MPNCTDSPRFCALFVVTEVSTKIADFKKIFGLNVNVALGRVQTRIPVIFSYHSFLEFFFGFWLKYQIFGNRIIDDAQN